MGILGQLPHTPDELPGHQVTSGEPPVPGGKAGEVPSLGAATSVSISLTPPVTAATAGDDPDAETE